MGKAKGGKAALAATTASNTTAPGKAKGGGGLLKTVGASAGSGSARPSSPTGRPAPSSDPRCQKLVDTHSRVFWEEGSDRPAGLRRATSVDLAPDQADYIIAVHNLLSPFECAQLVAAVDAVPLNEASRSDLQPRKNEAFLNRESLAFSDASLSDRLFSRLRSFIPLVDGRAAARLQEPMRYYLYRKGHRFGQHVDVSRCEKDEATGEELVSEYTLLIYLNGERGGGGGGDCDDDDDDGDGDGGAGNEEGSESNPLLQGGETVFHASARRVLCSVPPRQGTALLHAHGRRCLMHEGCEVTKGLKYVLRTDVMFKSSSSSVGVIN